MLYATIVKEIQQSFDHVNNRRWDGLMKYIAPNCITVLAVSTPIVASVTTENLASMV